MAAPDEILAKIRTTLSHAQKVLSQWENGYHDQGDEESVAYFVESAFIQTLMFLEASELDHTFRLVHDLNDHAKGNYGETVSSPDGDLYLKWALKLEQYLDAIGVICGEAGANSVTKDVIEIIRASVYAITDPRCFPKPPKNESEVHVRIEAVLRCVFPDLIHKPPIAKPIKSFEPDTGLRRNKTLIEYKYISSEAEAKQISDQILADVSGYVSKEWERCLYVVYETTRVRRENQWVQHLRECGVPRSTSIVVLSGELPRKRNATVRHSARAVKAKPQSNVLAGDTKPYP